MRVSIVAVLTISAEDINARLAVMLKRSRIRCSAARTATHTKPLLAYKYVNVTAVRHMQNILSVTVHECMARVTTDITHFDHTIMVQKHTDAS